MVPEVAHRLRQLGHVIPPELATVVLVAVKPAILERADCEAERKAFNRALAQHPDAVIEALRFVRSRIDFSSKVTAKSKAAVVREFLIAHNALIKRRGQLRFIGPLVKRDRLIRVADLTDKEVAAFLSRPGCLVDADSVRKARQRLTGKGTKCLC